jgi:hypothetical protein
MLRLSPICTLQDGKLRDWPKWVGLFGDHAQE